MTVDVTRRHAARLAAVQALYQMEMTGVDASSVQEEFVSFRFGAEPEVTALGLPDEEFFTALVHGVPRHQAEIDQSIAGALNKKWKLSRVDSTMRAILRAAVYELIGMPEVPAKAVISEYVDLARGFCNPDEIAFVNASLDTLARQKRVAEFGLAAPAGELEF